MLVYYDTYAALSDDLDLVAKIFTKQTGIILEEEEDYDYGGTYFVTSSPNDGEIKIYVNWNESIQQWVDSRNSGHPIIVDVSENPRHLEIEKELSASNKVKFVLVERGEYDREKGKYKLILSARNDIEGS